MNLSPLNFARLIEGQEECYGEWYEEEVIYCPVCEAEYDDHEGAADCCLWKDADLPARWRIAAAVRGGATWQEAIAAA